MQCLAGYYHIKYGHLLNDNYKWGVKLIPARNLISTPCHLPRWFVGRCFKLFNCRTVLVSKISRARFCGVKSLCQEVISDLSRVMNWQVLEDLVFADFKFGVR